MRGSIRWIISSSLLWLMATSQALAWDEFLVLTTDYSTFGGVVVVQRDEPWQVTLDLDTVGSDPVGRFHAGFYYVVNRGGANTIQVLDPADSYRTVREFSLGSSLNLQDIAFDAQGLAYVSCYDTAVLLKIDPQDGTIIQSISTAGFADADGLPETAGLQVAGTRLFIACQRLDRNNLYAPTGTSSLLVYDLVTEDWIDLIPATPEIDPLLLSAQNPYVQLELSPDRSRLKVGGNGQYIVQDGGVEVVDPVSLTSLGLEISEAQLGGDLLDFVTIGENLVYAIVSDANLHTALKRYDPQTGAVVLIEQANDFNYEDLAYDGAEYLYLADRALGGSGIRVFDAASGQELTLAPLATGLPPFRIVLPVDDALVAVSAEPLSVPLQLEALWPNPSNPAARLSFRGLAESAVDLAVYDLRGRRVRAVRLRTGGDGRGSWRFDGRDDQGRLLGSGVYQIVIRSGPHQATRILTVVR